jgi:hypothetical protein
MTREEHRRLYELIQNPPPGSKMEAAKNYGIDSLTLTPEELAQEIEAALRSAEALRPTNSDQQ